MTDTLASTVRWLDERRQTSGLSVRPVDLAGCREWSLTDGELRHQSGRFFQVMGAQVSSEAYADRCLPMIRQHEIGVLGFLVTNRNGGVEWLLQAKTEPGSTGGTQLAPTVQATKSNQDRVHGGSPTRFLALFSGTPRDTVRCDLLASEQGTRFHRKLNRNMIVAVDPAEAPGDGQAWLWTSSASLKQLLTRDLSVNTDARSVVVSGPWALLADGAQPFANHAGDGAFAARMSTSYEAATAIEPILSELAARRAAAQISVKQVPMTWADGWRINGYTYPSREVELVEVSVDDREIDRWCQPLLTSERTESCTLYTQLKQGTLRFLFRFSAEPGLVNRVELAPTVQTDKGMVYGTAPAGSSATRLSVLQSDEGGRFLHCLTRYSIVEVEPGVGDTPRDAIWLNLSDIEALANRSGVFTNEARSVISLLLSLA